MKLWYNSTPLFTFNSERQQGKLSQDTDNKAFLLDLRREVLLYQERPKLEGGEILEKNIKDRIFRRSALKKRKNTISSKIKRKNTNGKWKTHWQEKWGLSAWGPEWVSVQQANLPTHVCEGTLG